MSTLRIQIGGENPGERQAPGTANETKPEASPTAEATLFERAGGADAFWRLVRRFYAGVETDPVLRPLYPADLTDSIRHTALFLIQYTGGPGTYSQERGHPRLRMRHLPFAIGPPERDAWVALMQAATEVEITDPAARAFLIDYFAKTATFMMNR